MTLAVPQNADPRDPSPIVRHDEGVPRASAFERFGAFAPVFVGGPEGKPGLGWWLVLLKQYEDGAAAVRVVRDCLERCDDRRAAVARLLLTPQNWRPRLVGCVAVLVAEPSDRPLDALLQAVRAGSFVAPQLLVTASLVCPVGWEREVADDVLERGHPKAAAAFVAVSAAAAPELEQLATTDRQGGAAIARRWRESTGASFEEAGLKRWWD